MDAGLLGVYACQSLHVPASALGESLKLFAEEGKSRLNKKKIAEILKHIGEGVEEWELGEFFGEFWGEAKGKAKARKRVEEEEFELRDGFKILTLLPY